MPPSLLRQLVSKELDGTITASERDELEAMVREAARHDYEECPACGGAFTSDLIFEDEIRCPQCDTRLEHHSFDPRGHQYSEIDASIDEEQRLGEFTTGYTIPGTIPCLKCWLVYPKNYTCCPSLFTTALELHKEGTDSQRLIALQFIDTHAETLFNALRGRFSNCFNSAVREHFGELASELECGDALKGLLPEIAR